MTQRPSEPRDLALWTAFDRYAEELLDPAEPALEEALRASRAAGLPDIQVSRLQGRLLYLFARAVRARRILEIGTLGGYSTLWLARSLAADGRLLSLEIDPRHAEIARANLARGGVADRVEVRLGRALETLAKLAGSGEGPFDLTFVDADKVSYPEYFDWAVRLSRPGGLVVADNVVRRGDVADPRSTDENVLGVRRMLAEIATDERVEATVVQTVGPKGHDGFLLALVRSPVLRPRA
jgi:predicted O-methyltransferase YrrM